MKKKVLALLLAAAMTCSLAGCGGSSGNGESASGDMASDEAGEEQDEASEESSGTENEAGAETAEGSGEEQDFSGITLTIMSTNENTFDGIDAVIAAAEEKFGFTVEYDITGSGGEDYNNLVRSRLASGDMDTVRAVKDYNSDKEIIAYENILWISPAIRQLWTGWMKALPRWCPWMGRLTAFLIPHPMQEGFFTTRRHIKSWDWKFPIPGMTSLQTARLFRKQDRLRLCVLSETGGRGL